MQKAPELKRVPPRHVTKHRGFHRVARHGQPNSHFCPSRHAKKQWAHVAPREPPSMREILEKSACHHFNPSQHSNSVTWTSLTSEMITILIWNCWNTLKEPKELPVRSMIQFGASKWSGDSFKLSFVLSLLVCCRYNPTLSFTYWLSFIPVHNTCF